MSLLSCPHCFWAWGHASPVVICFYISSPSLEHSPWGDWTLGKPYLQPFWADTSPGAECSGAVAGFPDLHLPLQLVPGPFLFFLSSSAFLLLLSPSSLPFSPFPPSLILSLLLRRITLWYLGSFHPFIQQTLIRGLLHAQSWSRVTGVKRIWPQISCMLGGGNQIHRMILLIKCCEEMTR